MNSTLNTPLPIWYYQIVNFETKTLFSDHQNSVKSSPKSRKWCFRDCKFKNVLGSSALAFSLPNQKEFPTALESLET